MPAELRAFHPSLRDRIAWAIAGGAGALGADKYTQQSIAHKTQGLLDFIPGVGEVLGADDVANSLGAGNYRNAAINLGAMALGAVPVVGDIAGKGVKKLGMDEAERLSRAKGMGFYTNLPLYHGSDANFPSFDLGQAGSTTRAAPSQLGVWTATDPDTAAEFADLAAKSRGGSQQVYPLVHRAGKPGLVDLDGTEKNHEIAATLADAFDAGHDAVMLRNYTTPAGKTGKNIVIVRDPAQLRSKFARFDPSKKTTRDLLASMLIGMPLGAMALGAGVKDGNTQ